MLVYLVAVVAGVLLLAAVPGDVSGAVTLVAPVLLLAALPGKMTEPVALVALAAATAAATETSAISESASETSATSSTAPAVTVVHAISFGTLAGKMADPVAAVTHGASGALAIRALAGKVASPEERNSIIVCEAFQRNDLFSHDPQAKETSHE